MNTEHWEVLTDGEGFYWIDEITDDGGATVCNVGHDDKAEERARFIHRACKSHDKLLEACKAADCGCLGWQELCQAAIALAEKGSEL